MQRAQCYVIHPSCFDKLRQLSQTTKPCPAAKRAASHTPCNTRNLLQVHSMRPLTAYASACVAKAGLTYRPLSTALSALATRCDLTSFERMR